MRRVATACLLAVLVVAPAMAQTGQMNDAERAFLVEQLESSKKYLLDSIAGLTTEQWIFRQIDKTWSVAHLTQHIVLGEDYLLTAAGRVLEKQPVDRLPTSNAKFDRELIAAVVKKGMMLPEPTKPLTVFVTRERGAREFISLRDKTVAYAKTTQDELRTHAAVSPAGRLDAYQYLLLIVAHTSEHTNAILKKEKDWSFRK